MNEEILKELERYIDEETNGSYKVDALIAKKVVNMAVTAKDLEHKKVLEEILKVIDTHNENDDMSYCDTGEDMDYGCRSECVKMAYDRVKTLIQDKL